ncbi:tetratricopeptide repeat protein [Candidatus Sumerlaeota bacterium]|nr:tetratricopeptide repeat protein [Candidatus Sumerlaeota bacterium]
MKTYRKSMLMALLLAASLNGASPAEKVTLTNGDTVEGQILDQNERTITIKASNQTLTLPRTRVKSVEAGQPGSLFIMQAKDALKRNDYRAARDFIEEAKKAGALAHDTDPITQQLDKRQAEIELSKYAELLKEARTAAQQIEESEPIRKVEELMKTLPPESPARAEIVTILCDFHLKRVLEFRDKVRNEMAIQELSKIIALDPNRAMTYVDLADIYAQASTTWNEALQNYDLALGLNDAKLDDATRARIYWRKGEILRQQSKLIDAAECYQTAYKLNAGVSPRITDQITDVSRRAAEPLQGTDNARALEIVDKALQVKETTDLLWLKGNLLRRLGRYDDSNRAYQRVAERAPRTRDLYFNMAQNDMSKGEILSARDMLMKEIELFPNNYDALCEMGNFGLLRDDYEGAEGYYFKAVGIDPDLPRASLGLGRAYRQKAGSMKDEEQATELQKARDAVQAVLDRLPDNREANLEMGRILRDENNFDEASQFFTQVLDLIAKADPREQDELKELHADALIARGELALMTTGPGTASNDFRKALEVLPDYSQAYYSIGMAYRKKFASSKQIADLKTAEENMLKARSLASENAQFALELGILYQQQLAQADPPNEKDYFAKAITNYRDYIKLGGANAPQVQTWINEIEAK